MEQPPKPSPEQMRPPTSRDSFSRKFLDQILQLSFVKYPLELLQKASVWIGLVLPVGTIRSKLWPPSPSPARPGLLARKRRGKLVRLLLSLTPTSIHNFLGYLPTDWGQSNVSKEIREALIDPGSKASKRKRDDVALEKQESWLVMLERDFPEDDSDDLWYEPSEVESDSDEYRSQNDTDLELEEQDGITVQEPSAVQLPQGSVLPSEPGAEDPAVASGDAWEPGAARSSGEGSEQEADTACDTSLSQDGENQEA